jgi:hypothetical protein
MMVTPFEGARIDNKNKHIQKPQITASDKASYVRSPSDPTLLPQGHLRSRPHGRLPPMSVAHVGRQRFDRGRFGEAMKVWLLGLATLHESQRAASGHFETKLDALSVRVYKSGPPA